MTGDGGSDTEQGLFPVIAELVAAGVMRNAIEEIKRLHAPVEVCPGCHLIECPGDCDWNEGCDDTARVCGICCWDNNDNAREQTCIDTHDHDRGGPACSTAAIIARAGL